MAVIEKFTEAKVSAPTKTIDVKDVIIQDGKLTDLEGTDVLAEIESKLPEGVKAFSFKIKFTLPDDFEE